MLLFENTAVNINWMNAQIKMQSVKKKTAVNPEPK